MEAECSALAPPATGPRPPSILRRGYSMGTTVTLRKSQARLNPQDLSAITCWIGTSSAGTVDEMQTFTNTTALRTDAGYSPTCSGIAETLGVGGAPVYFVRSNTDTPGVVAAVDKTPISAGVAFAVWMVQPVDMALGKKKRTARLPRSAESENVWPCCVVAEKSGARSPTLSMRTPM